MQPEMLQDMDSRFPPEVRRRLGRDWLRSIAVFGDLGILRHRRLGLICSVRCPGSVVLKTYDATRELRDAGVVVAGGFHSPMEKECLQILLRGCQPVIVCPAISIERMRIPSELKKPLEEGRLLFLSPFPEKERRVTKKNAAHRNRFVAALADKVFVPHAEPSSKTEQLCREIISWKKPLYTLDDRTNANLIRMGAVPIGPQDVRMLTPERG